MNRQQFIAYMDNPDKLSGNDSALLAEILKNFPYFQTAHLLYTKSLHNQQSIHYNNQLKITAAYATNRKRLHQLITTSTNLEEEDIISRVGEERVLEQIQENVEAVLPPVELKEEPIPVVIVEPVAEAIQVESIVESAPEIVSEKIIEETEVVSPEEKTEAPETIVNVEPELVAQKPPIQIPVEEIKVDVLTAAQILAQRLEELQKEKGRDTTAETEISPIAEAPEQSIIEEEKTEPSFAAITEPSIENNTEVSNESAIVAEAELIITEPEHAITEEIIEAQKEEEQEVQKETRTAIITSTPINDELEKEYLAEAAAASVELDILNYKQEIEDPAVQDIVETNFVLNTPIAVTNVEGQKEITTNFDDSGAHSFAEWLTQIAPSPSPTTVVVEKEPESPKEERITLKKSSNDLIERFLKEEPKLKPKTEFFNPVNMAKQSVSEDITFVSETLAKIYLLQENYAKALEAYETLRLKYPEKRVYFATQIKKIRKLINQNNQEK